MPVALITGVAGFLGSYIAEELLIRGYEVRGVDNLIGGYVDNVPKDVIFSELDLVDFEAGRSVFANVDLVVHAACTAYEGLSVFSPAFITLNTFQITSNVISHSIRSGVEKIVFTSSMARYGNLDNLPYKEDQIPKPQDPYGISKLASENLLINMANAHGFNYVILVPHNIYGPKQKYDDPFRNVASIMTNRILQGKQPIIYGDGEQMRCFSYIADVISPIVQACTTDKVNGLIVNIGPDDEFVSINELAQRIAVKLDFELHPIYLPGRPQEVANAYCSSDLSRELLGYESKVSLDLGLNYLIEWIQERGPKDFDYHLPIEFVKDNTPKSWTGNLFNE